MLNRIKGMILKILVPERIKSLFCKGQGFLKGKKSYIAGAILMLQGIALMVEQLSGLSGLGELVSWFKTITANEGVLLFAQGLAVTGIRAGISKTKETAK